jgi:hypothetical protein
MKPTQITVCIPHICSANIEIEQARKLVGNLNRQISDSWEDKALKTSLDSNSKTVKYKKIPIIISKYDDAVNNGWRAEIADTYQAFKPACYDDLNFEDLLFHFGFPIETHPNDYYLFKKRKDAVEAAKYVNDNYLQGKAKLWFL